MAGIFFSKLLRDSSDLYNNTGNCPGYYVSIAENGHGISLEMLHGSNMVEDEPTSVFMNASEADALIKALSKAIERVEFKYISTDQMG